METSLNDMAAEWTSVAFLVKPNKDGSTFMLTGNGLDAVQMVLDEQVRTERWPAGWPADWLAR